MRSLLLALALLFAGVPAAAAAAETSPARARTEAFIATFQKVKSDGSASRNEAVLDELDGFLDFETLVGAPIAPRKEKFTEAQLQRFRTTFRRLFREGAYANSGTFFREGELKIASERTEGDTTLVTIEAYLPSEDLEAEVGLRWKEVDGALRIVDILFDGDSLLLDYRNQFTRIVDQEGVEALLQKIEAKLAELQAAGKAGGTQKDKGGPTGKK